MRCSAFLLALLSAASAVKEHDFRKCKDTPFCGRHREAPPEGMWHALNVKLMLGEGAQRVPNECYGLTASLVAPDATRAQLPLSLSLSVLASGAVRVRVDEDDSIALADLMKVDPGIAKPEEWDEDMDGPWDAPMLKLGRAVKGRFAPTQALASPGVLAPVRCEYHELEPARPTDGGTMTVLRCQAGGGEVAVRLVHSPFRVELLDPTTRAPAAVFNGRSRLMFESYKQKLASGAAEADKGEPVKFNSFTDEQPFGTASVGADVDFPLAAHLYGMRAG